MKSPASIALLALSLLVPLAATVIIVLVARVTLRRVTGEQDGFEGESSGEGDRAHR